MLAHNYFLCEPRLFSLFNRSFKIRSASLQEYVSILHQEELRKTMEEPPEKFTHLVSYLPHKPVIRKINQPCVSESFMIL